MDKKDYEGVLNELLGLDISWGKLPREDLVALAEFFSDDKRVFDTLGKEMIKGRVESKVDKLFKRVKMYKESGKGGIVKEILGR